MTIHALLNDEGGPKPAFVPALIRQQSERVRFGPAGEGPAGPNVIADLKVGMTRFLERNADRGWTSLADFRGLRRSNIVPQSQIGRPDASAYHGGREEPVEATAGA